MKNSPVFAVSMKKTVLHILAVLACAGLLFSGTPAAAETKAANAATDGQLTIGIVDMDLLMQKSSAAKHVRSQIDKKRSTYQGELKALDQKLAATKQDLMKGDAKLTPEDLKKKQSIFYEKVVAAQKKTQTEQRAMDAAVERSLNELRKKTALIIRDVAKERKIDVVLSHQAVIIAASALDITDEVLARLDKDMKTLPVKW
ncbi:MAG: OmpH family outer membrane protein [Pseudomonadota bacterium]|nr:OmpH family outer membrane protein [Pseudomonadota bacterium]QKK05171.1 MAG: OmpH family outer membrane protein [Pseudomonadota bacterium]